MGRLSRFTNNSLGRVPWFAWVIATWLAAFVLIVIVPAPNRAAFAVVGMGRGQPGGVAAGGATHTDRPIVTPSIVCVSIGSVIESVGAISDRPPAPRESILPLPASTSPRGPRGSGAPNWNWARREMALPAIADSETTAFDRLTELMALFDVSDSGFAVVEP